MPRKAGGTKVENDNELEKAKQRGDEAQKMERDTRRAFLGYAVMDVLEDDPELKFGTWNPRALNTVEGDKLFKSFINEGIQRFAVENAIPVIVERDWIDVDQLAPSGDEEYNWPDAPWTEKGQTIKTVNSPGGRHRLYALEKLKLRLNSEVEQVKRLLKKKGEKGNVVQLREDHRVKEEALKSVGRWLVAFYDSAKALKDDAKVARFLSRNQAKHIYAETASEKLTSMLQEILDAENEGPQQKSKVYARVAAEATQTASKLSGFFQNQATVELYLRFMRLPGGFRSMEAMSLKWAQDTFRGDCGGLLQIFFTWGLDNLEALFADIVFPSEADARKTMATAKNGTNHEDKQAAIRAIHGWRGLLFEHHSPQRNMLTSDFIKEVDEIFLKELSPVAEYLGTDDRQYQAKLSTYYLKVYELAESLINDWRGEDGVNQNVSDRLLSKIYIMKLQLSTVTMFDSMPLLTPSVVLALAETWSRPYHGIREIASWFDPLVWYNKSLTRSQEMADFATTLFKAIRMIPELSTTKRADNAVRKVALLLFLSRNTILEIDSYLQDSFTRLDRIISKGDLEKSFSTTQEAREIEPDEETITVKFIASDDRTDWLQGLIRKNIKRKNLAGYLKEFQEELVDALKRVDGKPGKRLSSMYGGNAIFRSVWQPSNIPVGSRSREFPVMIRCAIQEALAVGKYRRTMLQILPTANALRAQLAEIITENMAKEQDTLDDREGPTFEFWDGINDIEVNNDDLYRDIESALEENETARQAANDRVAIQKVVESIESSRIAKISDKKVHRDYVALEVSKAVDELIWALSVNTSRRRLRERDETSRMTREEILEFDILRRDILKDVNSDSPRRLREADDTNVKGSKARKADNTTQGPADSIEGDQDDKIKDDDAKEDDHSSSHSDESSDQDPGPVLDPGSVQDPTHTTHSTDHAVPSGEGTMDVDNKVPFRDSIQEFTTPSNSRDSILGFTTPAPEDDGSTGIPEDLRVVPLIDTEGVQSYGGIDGEGSPLTPQPSPTNPIIDLLEPAPLVVTRRSTRAMSKPPSTVASKRASTSMGPTAGPSQTAAGRKKRAHAGSVDKARMATKRKIDLDSDNDEAVMPS